MMFTVSFIIIDNIEDYIDPRLSQVYFGASFCQITNLVVDECNEIMIFIDGIKRDSYQTPYMMREFKGMDYERLDYLGSQLILWDDDVGRGFKSTSDLSRGFSKM